MSLEFFRQSPLLAFPLAALLIFMAVFVVITVRAVLGGKWESVAQLPLDGGDHEGGAS